MRIQHFWKLWCTCRSIHSYLKLMIRMYWWPILIHTIHPLKEVWVFLPHNSKNQIVTYSPVLRISSVWATICPVQWAVLQFVIIVLEYQAVAEYLRILKHLLRLHVHIFQHTKTNKTLLGNQICHIWMEDQHFRDPLGLHHKGQTNQPTKKLTESNDL
jgi:hypothetical protein